MWAHLKTTMLAMRTKCTLHSPSIDFPDSGVHAKSISSEEGNKDTAEEFNLCFQPQDVICCHIRDIELSFLEVQAFTFAIQIC